MPALRTDVDPDGLLEYSVVYTDRALNHMSAAFQTVMNGISSILKGYRWSQILEAGNLTTDIHVLKAARAQKSSTAPFSSLPIDDICAAIREHKPDIFFAPHVETSAGMILPDEYIKAIGLAVKEVGGLFILDCIASGTVWVDVATLNVDVLISAPQKGWSGPSSSGFVVLGKRGLQRLGETQSDSYSCDLRKWHDIMLAFENGGHAYHATMPTDALRLAHEQMKLTQEMGFKESRERVRSSRCCGCLYR